MFPNGLLYSQCLVTWQVLDLLHSVALSSRRVTRRLCLSPYPQRTARAILSADAEVSSCAAELLARLCDSQPAFATVLHKLGVFRFFLATIPVDTGLLSPRVYPTRYRRLSGPAPTSEFSPYSEHYD